MSYFLTPRMVAHERRSHTSVFGVLALGAATFSGLCGMYTGAANVPETQAMMIFFLGSTLISVVAILWSIAGLSVQLRDRQYRTLRLLGYSRGRIINLVLMESALVGLMAGIVGAFGGPLVMWLLISMFTSLGIAGLTTLSPLWTQSFIVALLLTVSLAIVAGIRAVLYVVKGKNVANAPMSRTSLMRVLFVWVMGLVGCAWVGYVALLAAQDGSLSFLNPMLSLPVAMILCAPAFLKITSWLLSKVATANGSMNLFSIAVLREKQRPQVGMVSLAAAVLVIVVGMTTTIDAVEFNRRNSLAKATAAAQVISTTDGAGMTQQQKNEVCAQQPKDCQHIVTLETEDSSPKFAHATVETFSHLWGANAMSRSVIPTKEDQSVDFRHVSENFLPGAGLSTAPMTSPEAGLRYFAFLDAPSSGKLPAGVISVTPSEWASAMPADAIMHSGSGSRLLLPTLSVILLMGAAFLFSGSYLRGHSLKNDNRNLVRTGVTAGGVARLMVYSAALPALTAIFLTTIAGMSIALLQLHGLKKVGYPEPQLFFPFPLAIVTWCVVLMMLAGPALVRAAKRTTANPA